MLQAAENNLLVTVSMKYIKNITNILRESAIQNNSSVDPSDIVNIVGTVASIPYRITTKKRGYAGFSTKDIQIGDTVIFRFDVIYQFTNISQTERKFTNQIWYNGQEYWACDIQKVFAVIRDGEIKMVNGYVMIEDYEPPKIILSQGHARVRGAQQSQVLHIGSAKENLKNLDIVPRETIYFNPNVAAKYQINGKPFRIIQQASILCKEAD